LLDSNGGKFLRPDEDGDHDQDPFFTIEVVKRSMELDQNNGKYHGNAWGKDAFGKAPESPHYPMAKCAYI
jgi:hypothetical protein